MKRTALYAEHLKSGAKMTDFHGWDMPLYYTSILEEHTCVRTAAGLFDISHMGQVWVSGPEALQTLNELVVSDLAQVAEGRACYTLLLNEEGGIIDDIIVYRVAAQTFLVIINCANRSADCAWLTEHRRGQTQVRDISAGRSILAIQGPRAGALLEEVLQTKVSGLGRFDIIPLEAVGSHAWLARTGYTGSDGFEMFLPDAQAVRLWQHALERAEAFGSKPVGLGARDTLRLEAGLRLYGTDMDASTGPYEAGLGWTVALGKSSFLGKDVLVRQKAGGVAKRLVGFELAEGPVPRTGCALYADLPAPARVASSGEATDRQTGGRQVGAVTSGTFSLMLHKPIGMGYVEAAFANPGTMLNVAIRTKQYPATVVKLPFWRARQVTQEPVNLKRAGAC